MQERTCVITMKILQAESCPLNIMSMLLKLSVLVSQVLMPTIYAYSNISVSIDGSYTARRGTVYVSIDGRKSKKICSHDNNWSLASVVCRELGHGPPTMASVKAYDGTWYDFYYGPKVFPCKGEEKSLSECYKVNTYGYYGSCSDFLEVKCRPRSSYAIGFSVAFVFFIIICCTGVICIVLYKKKIIRSSRQPVAMTNLTSGATVPLQSQEPVVHPPSPPYKDVVGPTSECPPPPVYHPNMGYPPATGYPTAPGPGYPTAPGPGYPTAPDPGYPPVSGTGYPAASTGYSPTSGSGYPPAPDPGYQPGPGHPTASGPGYPIAPEPGYPSAPAQGYPTMPGPGYPSASGPGYPTVSDPGNLPPKSSGYLPGSGPEYKSEPPDGGTPAGGQGRPAPSAPPSDFPSASE